MKVNEITLVVYNSNAQNVCNVLLYNLNPSEFRIIHVSIVYACAGQFAYFERM